MLVRVEYKNKKLQTVGSEDYQLDIYCQKLSYDLTKILSDIESTFENQYEKYGIEFDDFFKLIRHKILDVAGAIKRLPDNIIQEKICEDDPPQISENAVSHKKATLANVLGIFKG